MRLRKAGYPRSHPDSVLMWVGPVPHAARYAEYRDKLSRAGFQLLQRVCACCKSRRVLLSDLLFLRRRDETKGGGVDAVAEPRRSRTVGEHMAEMGIALRTQDFNPFQQKASVRLSSHI